MERKYEAAVRYFEKGDHYRALPLFEELVTVYRGVSRGESVYYQYAYCHYHLGDFELASFHFENFTNTYPSSEFTEECMYMNAYCYFLNSPTYSLDQTNTYKAINQLQLFVNRYPKSSRASQCNELIDKLRSKLESKAFDNAKLYYKTGSYKAAGVAFGNVLKDFPSTQFAEECQFLIVKSSFLYAMNSIDDRQLERLKDVISNHQNFVDGYPQSKYIKESESMFDGSVKKLEKNKIQ